MSHSLIYSVKQTFPSPYWPEILLSVAVKLSPSQMYSGALTTADGATLVFTNLNAPFPFCE